tara:strand:+ start:482 stop:628 length:147 start_codon:yes stop_codon:yes gene_type:complete
MRKESHDFAKFGVAFSEGKQRAEQKKSEGNPPEVYSQQPTRRNQMTGV